jgi:hypothetical protein
VVSTQHTSGYDEGDKEPKLHAYVKRGGAEVIPPVLLREDRMASTRPAASKSAVPMATRA